MTKDIWLCLVTVALDLIGIRACTATFMAFHVSITTSRRDQSAAADSLSRYLEKLNFRHAFIGGLAWALLGSVRPTQMNVLIETKNLEMKTLREKLTELNRQFASAGIKLFYVKEPIGDLRDDELVRASKDNVLIETLIAGSMGLPVVAEPVYNVEHESGRTISILHPRILVLTKMKRWSHYHDSDRPKTILKNQSDQADIEFILNWLAANELFICFEDYQGKSRSDLLAIVRVYRNKFITNPELMDTLKTVMKPEDWEELCEERTTETLDDIPSSQASSADDI